MLNTSALSAWVSGIKGYLESWLGLTHAWCCSYGALKTFQPTDPLNGHLRRVSLIMYNTAKLKSPGTLDDQAEGCRALFRSHLTKWIPLPRVIFVSYNKKLIHNMTHAEMQMIHRVLSKDVQGNYIFCRQSLDELLCLWSTPGTIS